LSVFSERNYNNKENLIIMLPLSMRELFSLKINLKSLTIFE
jgi:hypothetical protein